MKKDKRTKVVIAALIVILVCIVILLSRCAAEPGNKLPVADGQAWNGESVNGGNSEVSQEYISIPGYSQLYANADNPYILLVNPGGNTVYFKYSVFNNGALLHETELIKPGEMLRWKVTDELDTGEYSLEIKITTYDLTTQVRCNGATMPATLRVSA